MSAEQIFAGPPPRSAAFEAYLAASREGRRGFWRVLAALFLVLASWFLLFRLIAYAVAFLGEDAAALLADERMLMIAVLIALSTTPAVLALALNLLHGRSFSTLLGAGRRLESGPLLIGGIAAVALSAVSLGVAATMGFVEVAPIQGYEPPWLLLAAAGALIPAQAAGEELLFRGYLLQEFGSRLPYVLVWAAAPSAIFASLHFDGAASGEAAAAYIGSTFLFGVAAAALVWRTGGLSAPIGLHVVNNWIAICLFEPAQGVAGLGPLAIRFREGGETPSLLLDMILLCAAVAVLWRVLPQPRAPKGWRADLDGGAP